MPQHANGRLLFQALFLFSLGVRVVQQTYHLVKKHNASRNVFETIVCYTTDQNEWPELLTRDKSEGA